MQRTCPHLAPILRRCGAELAHCIRLHNFVAEFWLSAVRRGEEGYWDWEDTPELPTLTICAEMNLGQQQQRRQHAVRGKVAETFQENHDFLLKIFLGLPNGNANKQQGQAMEREGRGRWAAASCAGGFALGSASISHFHKISNRSFIWQLCPILDRERRICMERFARDLSMIARLKIPQIYLLLNAMTNQFVAPGAATLCQQLI